MVGCGGCVEEGGVGGDEGVGVAGCAGCEGQGRWWWWWWWRWCGGCIDVVYVSSPLVILASVLVAGKNRDEEGELWEETAESHCYRLTAGI